METIGKELRYTLRLLRQSPVFSIFAVLSLALGIAANVAIFSIVNGVLLKPLGFPQPDRLFAIVEIVPKIAQLYPVLPVNPRHAAEWRQTVPAIEQLGLALDRNVVVGGFGQPLRLAAANVTPELLTTLKVRPLMGRLIQASDAQEGRDHVVVLTYALWRGRFAGDPNIIGRDLRIEGVPNRIIGVLTPDFHFPAVGVMGESVQPLLLKPLALRLSEHSLEGDFNYAAIARIKPGVRRQTALAMLNSAQAAITKTLPDKMELRADLIPLNEFSVRRSRVSLLLILGAVSAVLLIVCLNLATLMLARGTLRNREIAVRTALGASRWRLIREAFLEALILSAAGGALGISLAKAGFRAILAAAPATLPRRDEVTIDTNVLLFALGLTLLTALVFGLYPAWRQSRRDPQEALAASGRSNTATKSGTRGRTVLVAIEVGLSTVLLIIGGLLLVSFQRLVHTDIGFQIANQISADINLPYASYTKPASVTAFYDKLLDELSRQPGIHKVAVTSQLPLAGETWIDVMSRPGDTRPIFQRPTTNVRFISGSYFETIGSPLLAGRTFGLSDKKTAVAIISKTVARVLWPRENPVGQTLLLDDEPLKILGLAGDVRADPDKPAPPVVYLPYWQSGNEIAPSDLTVIMRSNVPEHDAISVLRGSVAKVDSAAPISHVETFAQVLSDAVSQRRFQMLLIGAFAISALLVAALGIFGVIAGVVSGRRNEIGIRMALGASATGVVGMVIRQGMMPVLAGLLAGVIVTIALSSGISKLLYQVRATDPLTFLAVALLLSLVAALACWIPARRAASIDPMEALRYE